MDPSRSPGPTAPAPVWERHPGAAPFVFGDSRALCDALLALVRTGRKTATCGALRDFRDGGDPLPVVGRRDVAMDWDGRPALVVETTEVSVRRFEDVDEAFAMAEGAESLADWRQGHEAFLARNGGFDPAMELLCERFSMVEDLATPVEAA